MGLEELLTTKRLRAKADKKYFVASFFLHRFHADEIMKSSNLFYA